MVFASTLVGEEDNGGAGGESGGFGDSGGVDTGEHEGIEQLAIDGAELEYGDIGAAEPTNEGHGEAEGNGQGGNIGKLSKRTARVSTSLPPM